ncbi:MAG: ADP-forming succinate--CoA ligase subunit beta [Chloroflexi bacterium]|nr:ADP-forming succinate--CoA ligase subunit beta [Chloroflexota bacterium]MBT3669410.1 ADP-forming succinate--CoA ligase subunit beta [Chloroflexota bacterium]MBT4304571.1 ADP-forming succinate--CoA ligase subunit beta [Chloroflexota bacterium]MBT4534088.1 ADP-forming succinate--CoA ligase subunit beta [Chloroflexota bacterium]MBT4683307.1 ADP-forming succinate--CoA ligase subunit beta [Chloroflexota bacterium]
MKLHEYQSKRIFAKFGVPIPKGEVATTPEEAKKIAQDLGGSVVVKSQVLVGGRGKAGGIKLAKSPDEAEKYAKEILDLEIKGLPVNLVLIDEAAEINNEIYLGITNDRGARMPVFMASAAGGVDIEEVAATTPEKIIKVHIHPLMGLQNYQVLDLAAGISLPRALWKEFDVIAKGLWEAYKNNDATLAEINPLIITADNHLKAVDGKMVIDDNALFRQKELNEQRDLTGENEAELKAKESDLTFIKLDGDIGCMVNGAGLAMATMDILDQYGGSPANFLDIGGGADEEQVAAALRIILEDENVKAVLFNIFGGITRGDQVAKGIVAALKEIKTDIPMVVRLVGTNSEEGREILAETKMITAKTLSEAAKKSVAAAKGEL